MIFFKYPTACWLAALHRGARGGSLRLSGYSLSMRRLRRAFWIPGCSSALTVLQCLTTWETTTIRAQVCFPCHSISHQSCQLQSLGKEMSIGHKTYQGTLSSSKI
jgi:hypothetical protein